MRSDLEGFDEAECWATAGAAKTQTMRQNIMASIICRRRGFERDRVMLYVRNPYVYECLGGGESVKAR